MPKRPSPPRTNSISASPIETTRGLCSLMPVVLCREGMFQRWGWSMTGGGGFGNRGRYAAGAGLGHLAMLYYNKSARPPQSGGSVSRDRQLMPTNVPHQHHHPGHGHPPAAISPSMLRMSVIERLAVAAV